MWVEGGGVMARDLVLVTKGSSFQSCDDNRQYEYSGIMKYFMTGSMYSNIGWGGRGLRVGEAW